MRIKTYTRNNYSFKEYSGHFQKIKYDVKKEDYFLTFNKHKFYFSNCNCINPRCTDTNVEAVEDKNLIGTWQEGRSVYKLISKDDTINFSESSLCKIVYCPPSTN